MIAAWMLYCLLCAAGLAAAAFIAERALLAGGGPVRHVWIGALGLSVPIPIIAFRFAALAASRPLRRAGAGFGANRSGGGRRGCACDRDAGVGARHGAEAARADAAP